MLGRFLTLFLTLIKQRVATLRGTVGRSNTRERVEMGILTQGGLALRYQDQPE